MSSTPFEGVYWKKAYTTAIIDMGKSEALFSPLSDLIDAPLIIILLKVR